MGAVAVPPQPPPSPARVPCSAQGRSCRPVETPFPGKRPRAARGEEGLRGGAAPPGDPTTPKTRPPRAGAGARWGLASAPRRAAGGAPAPTWRRGEEQRGQVSGPG